MAHAGSTVWTIGHSTHSAVAFVGLLQAHGINTLVDVRAFPGSRRYPHFNQEALAPALMSAGIEYQHWPALGGRRKPRPDSANSIWKNESFRGYADYMETEEFTRAARDLSALAAERRVVIMCAEAVWWQCHRSMIADWLKAHGHEVLHILSENKVEPHPYTKPARIVGGRLTYHAQDELTF